MSSHTPTVMNEMNDAIHSRITHHQATTRRTNGRGIFFFGNSGLSNTTEVAVCPELGFWYNHQLTAAISTRCYLFGQLECKATEAYVLLCWELTYRNCHSEVD